MAAELFAATLAERGLGTAVAAPWRERMDIQDMGVVAQVTACSILRHLDGGRVPVVPGINVRRREVGTTVSNASTTAGVYVDYSVDIVRAALAAANWRTTNTFYI